MIRNAGSSLVYSQWRIVVVINMIFLRNQFRIGGILHAGDGFFHSAYHFSAFEAKACKRPTKTIESKMKDVKNSICLFR